MRNADNLFKGRIIDAKSKEDIKNAVESGKIARCGFCSLDKEGEKCAEIIEKEIGAEIRGKRFDEPVKKPAGKCPICNKTARETVYIARAY